MFKLRALVVAIAVFPALLLAFSSGPPLGVTGGTAGGFTEPNCTDCHATNPLNVAGGTFTISGVPANYTPAGAAIPITVTLSKSGQRRWGFELAVKVRTTGAQAGTLTSTTSATSVRTDTTTGVQYISHNSSGTQIGAAQGTWTFNWTPPATNVGEVAFMAAGNAANGNDSSSGDFIYTTQVSTLPPAQVTSPLPSKPVLTFIPHFVTGGSTSGGFVTRVLVDNLSTSSNGVVLNTISQSGQLVSAGQEQVLAPGASFQISTGEQNRLSNQTIQWLAIGSDGPISAVVFFDFKFASTPANQTVQAVAVLGVPSLSAGTSFTAPFIFQRDGLTDLPPLLEGLAIANVSDQSNTVTINLLDQTGATVATDTLTPLAGFNQTAFTVSTLPNISTFLTGKNTFLGVLAITGTQRFAPVIVGNLGAQLFSLPLTAQ